MLSKPLREIEFTIFDTETTGLDPAGGDRVIELAALRCRGGERLDSFASLINPHRDVPAPAFAVNHISSEMLVGAPEAGVVVDQFLRFAAGSVLCAYNAGFDMGFLNNELVLAGKAPLSEMMVLDVLKMARRLMPGLERYSLASVAKVMGIALAQEHRALSDVEMTFDLFNRFSRLAAEKGIEGLENFSRLFSVESAILKNLSAQRVAELEEAIELGASVRIRYLSSASAKVTEREVVPKIIREENNRIYVVGYCNLRREERSFRVDSILHLELVK